MKTRYLVVLIVFLSITLSSCGDEDYVYPPVKLEFLTAESGDDGNIKVLLKDDGERLSVKEDRTQTKIEANSTKRVISNYEQLATGEVRIYAMGNVVSPLPLPADAEAFKDGIKTDPAEILSIWMGRDYLNMVLQVKAQNGKHYFHFVEEKVFVNDLGDKCVSILLYHDKNGDVPAYTQRAYASIPLKQYADPYSERILIYFGYYAADGYRRNLEPFNYVPSEN